MAALWGFAGLGFTVGVVVAAVAIDEVVGPHLGAGVAQLFVVGAIVAAVFVARALPRRARAAFIVGVVTPAVLAIGFVALVLYSLATDPNAFTF